KDGERVAADEPELDEKGQPRTRPGPQLAVPPRPQDPLERAPVDSEPVVEDELRTEHGEGHGDHGDEDHQARSHPAIREWRPRRSRLGHHRGGHAASGSTAGARFRASTSMAPSHSPVITRPWGKLYGKWSKSVKGR